MVHLTGTVSWDADQRPPRQQRHAEDAASACVGTDVAPPGALVRMLRPRGIALVGVSGRPGNPMARPLRYLREHGFAGGVYPVNPGYQELEGLPCYASLAEVPGPVDLVLILVPAARAAEAVREAGAVGAAVAVVFASGFAETGEGGRAAQKALQVAGREAGVRVLGPNCQGVVHASTGLVATFTSAADRVLPVGRGVAYVGQSGAVGGSVLDLASEMGLGLTTWVSTGNQVDVDLVEVSAMLIDDPEINVVMLYVEAAAGGAAYTALARRARARGKHLVVLRSGRSPAGRRAASSHTGSMLGDDIGFVLTSRKYGVVLVNDVDELLSVAATLTTLRPSPGRRVGIVTTSGGAGSLAADRCEEVGLELPELGKATQDLLRPLIPPFGALANPVDVTAQLFNSGAHAFGDVCRLVADDPDVDVIGVLLTMVVGEAGAQLAEDLVATAAALSKPLLVAWLAGNQLTGQGRAVFRDAGIPVFGSVGELARTAALLAPVPPTPTPPSWLAPPPVLDEMQLQSPTASGEALLEALGIAQPRSVLVTSGQQAREQVTKLAAPAALKLHAPELAHKSDVGGVRLGVSASQAQAVFDEMLAAAAAHAIPNVAGVLVQEVIPPGVELIVGATAGKDGFPPVVTVGLGGVTTELYEDIISELAPVTPAQAYAMLRRLRAWPLLDGFRGAAPADVAAAVDALVRISHATTAAPYLTVLEVNPLIVGTAGTGALAVDVLVRTLDQDLQSPPP